EKSQVPIIMITSKTQENDTIRGSNLGADDYIAKPFRIKELIARIHALMRRTTTGNVDNEQEVLSFNNGQLTIVRKTSQVRSMGELVHLTRTEYKLLTSLVKVPGKIWSRNDLAYNVSGYRYLGDSRIIDTHIKNLRKKIEPDLQQPTYIQTSFGVGYKFSV